MIERKVTLTDGTVATVRPPGLGFEYEAFGNIPSFEQVHKAARGVARAKQVRDLEALARAEAELDGAQAGITRQEELRIGALCAVWATVDPALSLDRNVPGRRCVWDLLPEDVNRIAEVAQELRLEQLAADAERLRPTSAAAT